MKRIRSALIFMLLNLEEKEFLKQWEVMTQTLRSLLNKILDNFVNQIENKFIRDNLENGISEAKVMSKLMRMKKEEEYKSYDPPDPSFLLDILNEKI